MYFHCCLLWKKDFNLDYQVNSTNEAFGEVAIVAQKKESLLSRIFQIMVIQVMWTSDTQHMITFYNSNLYNKLYYIP